MTELQWGQFSYFNIFQPQNGNWNVEIRELTPKVSPSVENPVTIPVGGGARFLAPHDAVASHAQRGGIEESFSAPSLRAESRAKQSRGDKEGVQVASLLMLPGLLAGLANSAIADSNGEHLYFYNSDHLGTPLYLTDSAGVVVWKGEFFPFGEVFVESKDPDGDGVQVEQPFRFPGQYEDKETGLYFNYFRDYQPSIGRYVEADPIGLAGGINPFSFVENNSINFGDIFGLRAYFSPFDRVTPDMGSGGKIVGGALALGTAMAGAQAIKEFWENYYGRNNTGETTLENSMETENIKTDNKGCPDGNDPCKGLRRQVRLHEEKLRQYLNDPYGQDNLGVLKNNPAERHEKIINGRILNLLRQIHSFKKQLDECEKRNGLK